MLKDLETTYEGLTPQTAETFIAMVRSVPKEDIICLQAFLKGKIDSFTGDVQNIGTPFQSEEDKDLFILRMQTVAAFLLVCDKTDGIDFREKYLLLLEMLSRLSPRSANALSEKAVQCLTGEVDSIGFSWSDIYPNPSADILAYKIMQAEVKASESGQSYFANKGTLTVSYGKIAVHPYSETDKGPFVSSFSVLKKSVSADTKDKRDEKLKASDAKDVKRIEAFVNTFCNRQLSCVQAKRETKKSYREGDTMPVAVTGIDGDGNLLVRTIDPSHKVVSGKVKDEELVVGLYVNDLTEYILENSCITNAFLTEKDGEHGLFSIRDSYLDYVEEQVDYAIKKHPVFEAKAVNIFGTKSINWINYNGVGVITSYDPEVKVGDIRPLMITNSKDSANGFYVNARESDTPAIGSGEFDGDNVLLFFLKEYGRMMQELTQKTKEQAAVPLSETMIRSLAAILANSQKERNSLDLYRKLSFSRILYTLAGDNLKAEKVRGYAAFLKNCILFARGETVMFPERDIRYSDENNRFILSCLACVGNSEREGALCSLLATVPADGTVARIARLILAKNTALLADNDMGFSDAVLRREVSAILDVTDMVLDEDCADIPTGKYGNTERQLREYKSSYVFRNDDSGPDFLKQGRDEVFQAVCGLLNTDGGQVYIGVSNNGDPITDQNRGIAEDINWLNANYVKVNAIRRESLGRNVPKVSDIDSFVNFLSDEKSIYFKDTLLDNIIIEPTEDMDAICITVSPSEYEIAYLFEDYTHSQGQAFRRDGNRTIPMTEVEKQKRLMRLKSIGKEISFQIKIQEAIDQHKKIILKDYASTQKRDRFLAPINLLYGGESVWCVDLEDRNKSCKQFRLSRAEDVEVKDEKYQHGKPPVESDIFRFTGKKNIHIKLSMDIHAKNYLLEEYPEASRLSPSEFYETDGNRWILDTKITNIVGVRRFYVGLADKLEILDTEDSEAVKKNIREFLKGQALPKVGD